jgi:hypothetical protein
MRPSILAVLLLAACGVEDATSGPSDSLPTEQAAPPSGGILTTSAAIAGRPLRLRSVGHPSTSLVYFARGGAGSTCPPVLGGQCLDLASPTVLGTDPSDGMRTAQIQLNLPLAVPVGLTTLVQAANPTGAFATIISNTATIRIDASSPCAAGEVTLIHNARANLPLAGEFVQSYGGSTLTRVTDPITSSFTLQVTGNEDVTASFQPTPVSALTSASYELWHDPTTGAPHFVVVYYEDGSTTSNFLSSAFGGTGWETVDMLPLLDPTKSIYKLEIWGYSAGGSPVPNITRFDNLAFCAI